MNEVTIALALGGLLGLGSGRAWGHTQARAGVTGTLQDEGAAHRAETDQEIVGQFGVDQIEKVDSGGYFRLHFSARVKGADKAEQIVLDTFNPHGAVKEGSVWDIRALVTAGAQGEAWRAKQIMLYIQRPHGKVPVWMVAKDQKVRFYGTSYLKMHDPQSDYALF